MKLSLLFAVSFAAVSRLRRDDVEVEKLSDWLEGLGPTESSDASLLEWLSDLGTTSEALILPELFSTSDPLLDMFATSGAPLFSTDSVNLDTTVDMFTQTTEDSVMMEVLDAFLTTIQPNFDLATEAAFPTFLPPVNITEDDPSTLSAILLASTKATTSPPVDTTNVQIELNVTQVQPNRLGESTTESNGIENESMFESFFESLSILSKSQTTPDTIVMPVNTMQPTSESTFNIPTPPPTNTVTNIPTINATVITITSTTRTTISTTTRTTTSTTTITTTSTTTSTATSITTSTTTRTPTTTTSTTTSSAPIITSSIPSSTMEETITTTYLTTTYNFLLESTNTTAGRNTRLLPTVTTLIPSTESVVITTNKDELAIVTSPPFTGTRMIKIEEPTPVVVLETTSTETTPTEATAGDDTVLITTPETAQSATTHAATTDAAILEADSTPTSAVTTSNGSPSVFTWLSIYLSLILISLI